MRTCPRLAIALVAAALAASHVAADLVLLDEYWAPEITVNDVAATEIDTELTGDPTQAHSGSCSAKLENRTGWPSVRFRGAARVKLADLPPDDAEAYLWYRTDAWEGAWWLEVWVFWPGADRAPVKVLEAPLDAGGGAGRLIADNEWHEARGPLQKAEAWDRVSHDQSLVSYVWLRPEAGWDIPHTTYVDRVGLQVVQGPLSGKASPEPAKRIRPRPGVQQTGPGWVWVEGEDAVEHSFPPGGAWAATSVEEQARLSNETWLQYHGTRGMSARWEIEVAEAGRYALWLRGSGPPFDWRWNGGEWQRRVSEEGWVDGRLFMETPQGPILASWVHLADVEASAGKQTLEFRGVPENQAAGLDCWLLTREPFTPNGVAKPPGE